MSVADRDKIITEIYDKTTYNYKDIRNLNSTTKLENRLKVINNMMSKIEVKKRNYDNRRYKKLYLEKELVYHKLIIYDRKNFSSQSVSISLTRFYLQSLDRFYFDKEDIELKEERNRESTLLLLKMIFTKYSITELQNILNNIK